MTAEDITTKQCKKCGSYDRYKKGSCRKCAAEYREKKREEAKQYAAAYRSKNREKAIAYGAAWREKNREKARATSAAWVAANHPQVRIQRQNYRAKKKANGGKLSHGLAERLYKLQRGKCACCGLPLGDDYHLDHIMPIALGGTNTDDNIQLLRQQCNNQKHAKHPVDFMQSRGFLL